MFPSGKIVFEINKVILDLYFDYSEMLVCGSKISASYCCNKIIYNINTDIHNFNLTMLPLPSCETLLKNAVNIERLSFNKDSKLQFGYNKNRDIVLFVINPNDNDNHYYLHIDIMKSEYNNEDKSLYLSIMDSDVHSAGTIYQNEQPIIESVESIPSLCSNTLSVSFCKETSTEKLARILTNKV